ncbi:MAG TPA: nucleotidyltransferase family protein [Terriglobales bacterium]|nr:nucleotidyltransferase family protein [Terriglobales bacterium]
MKAMVLAAGLGTRLRPLTNDRPKALVEIGGRTLLEITLRRLREFGVREVIINVHHFAGMVTEYLQTNNCFGMGIEVSREDVLLDTGGGLKKASWFFLDDAKDSAEPFLLHNVDVISNIDFARMVRFHREQQALATLAVQKRETSRYLLFDETQQLCGRRPAHGHAELVRDSNSTQELAFAGIHVISPAFLRMLSENGAFSIIDSYLRVAKQGKRILAFRADQYHWRDLGTPQSLQQAEGDLRNPA